MKIFCTEFIIIIILKPLLALVCSTHSLKSGCSLVLQMLPHLTITKIRFLIFADDTDSISQRLVVSAKERGSSDNISVIVVFLKEPSKIAAEVQWANRNGMDAGLDNPTNQSQNNPFANEIFKDNNAGLLYEGYKQNGTEFGRNGKNTSEFDDDDDLGPETDVDAVDDGVVVSQKVFGDGLLSGEVKKEDEEVDHLEVQKKQSSEFDGERSPREETPTPPASAGKCFLIIHESLKNS